MNSNSPGFPVGNVLDGQHRIYLKMGPVVGRSCGTKRGLGRNRKKRNRKTMEKRERIGWKEQKERKGELEKED